MNLIRVMRMEVKKTITSEWLLSVVLLVSILISYSVLIYYNDSFFSEQRKYLSSHLHLHSVRISLKEPITCADAEAIMELVDEDICEYILLGTAIDTREQTYRLDSIWTMIEKRKNPYRFLFSTMRRERFGHEPQSGFAYVSQRVNIGHQGEGLHHGGSFFAEEMELVLSDYFTPVEGMDVLISNEDFRRKNRVDTMIYSYRESTPLRLVDQQNEKLLAAVPQAKIDISHTLDEMSWESYTGSILISSVLMLACMVNYCMIFTYLAGKRAEDYRMMRLFGLCQSQIAGMLVMEFLLYNLAAMLVSMLGFCIFWKLQDYTDLWIHIYTAIPIMMVFVIGSLIIGAFHILGFSRTMPIQYREQ